MRCGGLSRASALRATDPLLWFGGWWKGGGRRRGKDLAAAQQHYAATQHFIQNAAAGLGGNTALGDFPSQGSLNGDSHNDGQSYGGNPSSRGSPNNPHRVDQDGKIQRGGGFEAHLQSASKENTIDDLFRDHSAHFTGGKRLPLIYEIEARQRAQRQADLERQKEEQHSEHFDEWNMPREADNPQRPRADWEFTPTPEHKSLILLLYRNILKGLMDFKSVRKRSMIAYARFAFRRRANATEKYLIDECVEECRRAIYVLEKHRNFTRTRTYEFDTMTMPKDTGQDVKTYMEEVYDPEISRMQFQNFTDVQPGKEHLHKQGLGPASGANHWKKQRSLGQYNVEIREEDKTLRPPPPPEMSK
ncbi:unnamed protein product [Phytomonas sp. EM1]|nr:unnamed protein product [Phytomonas sp. EM1]|eukprot:CCW60226.1 unnamed protein product [Phytomonas sp. isolate EM1]